LQQRPPAADGRTRADAGDALEQGRAKAPDADGEDAFDRRPAAFQRDVGGRESEVLAETEAPDDTARHTVVAAEHRLSEPEIAGGERGADGRAADPAVAPRHRLEHRDVEAVTPPGHAKVVEVAGPAEPEAEIVADDEMARAQAVDEQFLDEDLRRQPPQRAEVRTEKLVDVQGPKQLEALAEARQSRRRILRRQ